MASADTFVNIYQKRFMSQQDADMYFFDYLRKISIDTRKRVFIASGIFQAVTLSADTNDTFDISTPCEGMDNNGNEMVMPTGLALTNNLPFENANGVVYSVGMRHNLNRPVGTQTNFRTRAAEYNYWKEVVGEVLEPDSVTNITTPSKKLKIIVDKPLLCDSAPFTHAGRLATVWLVNPVSIVEAVAIYDATVQWDGSNNYIEVPYTDIQGPLGQTDPDFPISTTASDYLVHIKGATVTRKSIKDLFLDSDYAWLGEVTGSGTGTTPTSFNIIGQNILALAFGAFSLDGAYDGPGGDGSGRHMTIDYGAVEMNAGAAGNGDTFASYLRIINDDKNWQNGVDLVEREYAPGSITGSGSSLIVRRKWSGNAGSGSEFSQSGVCTLGSSTDEITLPAGTYARLYTGICFIEVTGSVGLVDDGTYTVSGVTGNVINVQPVDGSSWAGFSGGSASYSITIAAAFLGGSHRHYPGFGGSQHWWSGLALLANPAVNLPALRIMHPEGENTELALEVGTHTASTGKIRLQYDGKAKADIFAAASSCEPQTDKTGACGSEVKRWRSGRFAGRDMVVNRGLPEANVWSQINEVDCGPTMGFMSEGNRGEKPINGMGLRRIWHTDKLPDACAGATSGTSYWQAYSFNVDLKGAGVSEGCFVRLTGFTDESYNGWYRIFSLPGGRDFYAFTLDGVQPTLPTESDIIAEFYAGPVLGQIGDYQQTDYLINLLCSKHPNANDNSPMIDLWLPRDFSINSLIMKYTHSFNSSHYAYLMGDGTWVGNFVSKTNGVKSNWSPDDDVTLNLGDSSHHWDSLYANSFINRYPIALAEIMAIQGSGSGTWPDVRGTFSMVRDSGEEFNFLFNVKLSGSNYVPRATDRDVMWQQWWNGVIAFGRETAPADTVGDPWNFDDQRWTLEETNLNSSDIYWTGNNDWRGAGTNLIDRGYITLDGWEEFAGVFYVSVNYHAYFSGVPSSVTFTQDANANMPATPTVTRNGLAGFDASALPTATGVYGTWIGRYTTTL